MIVLDSSITAYKEALSSGSQIKFYKDGCWVKLDSNRCHEGLAEEFASLFADTIKDFQYVKYIADAFVYNSDVYCGCYSYSMLGSQDVEFIPAMSLLRRSGISDSDIERCDTVVKKIRFVSESVSDLTGVDFQPYLCRLLLFDALIMNEDRSLANLGVCQNGQDYIEAPCFDNGCSLLCTNMTYRQDRHLLDNIGRASVQARPFACSFDEQVKACMELGTEPLIIRKLDLDRLLLSYASSIYTKDKVHRVRDVLMNRLQYYTSWGIYSYVNETNSNCIPYVRRIF